MGISRSPRTLTLDEPLDVEVLWHRLAHALPPLVQLFVPYPHRPEDAPRPELRGPTHLPDLRRRRYDCSDRGAFAHLDLYADDPSLSLCVTQRTVSNGLSVLELWSPSSREGIAELSVGCGQDRIDDVLVVLRDAIRS